MKYLGIKLPKETKDLHAENYKTLIKETNNYTNRWRNPPYSWIGRTNTVKMTMPPKTIHKFSAIFIKLPMACFTELKQKILQLVWTQKTLNSQSNLEKEKLSWRNHAPQFQPILQCYSNHDRMALPQNTEISINGTG